MLVIGWGSTYGAIAAGVQRVRARGHKVAQAHLVHLNPFPADLGDVLAPLQEGAGPRGQPGPAQPPAAGRVPGRRHLLHPGPGHPVPGGGHGGGHPPADRRAAVDARSGRGRGPRRRRTEPTERCPTDDRPGRRRARCPCPSPPARTGPRTRRSGGARGVATTRSWPPCRCSCPTSACAARDRVPVRASGAPPGSPTT